LKSNLSRTRPGIQFNVPAWDKIVDPFYRSAAWRSLVAEIIGERGRRCEAWHCSSTGADIVAGHIVALEDGGSALDRNNIRLLCLHCDGKATANERARRLAERFD
jgi:5-methylcytosine-specific restriction enzyme A